MHKWIFVGSLGAVFLVTLGFSYGSGYGGSLLAFLGNNITGSPEMSPSDTVTPVVTPKKMVTLSGVTNVTSLSPVMSPLIYNDGQSYLVSPSMSPVPSRTPTMSPSPSVTSFVSPQPRMSPSPATTPHPATPSPTSIPSATQAPVPVTIGIGSVVINEIAWMGTEASQYAEWIELYNITDSPIDLSGWKIIKSVKGTILTGLAGQIQAHGYYLIERITPSSSHSFNDITANVSSPFGGSGLLNAGEDLILQDSGGIKIDNVNGSAQWYGAGTASPEYKSMERIDSNKPGDDSTNWATNNGVTKNGYDIKGKEINGTPGSANSVFAL